MIEILQGNCLDRLKDLKDQSINTCITSPPYWGLRDYGTAEWEGGDPNCDHVDNINPRSTRPKGKLDGSLDKYNEMPFINKCGKCGATRKDNQLGLEETPAEYVENLVNVFREVKRVLRDDGTVWLNLGDSYSSHKDCKSTPQSLSKGTSAEKAHIIEKGRSVTRDTKKLKAAGLKNKDLVGIPWRVAFALQADGWYLRQDIIWHKPNPMPESVKDRCTKSHEYIFLLSKNAKYYYDNDAVREPHTWEESKPRPSGMERNAKKYREKVKYGGGGTGFSGHSGSLKADGTSLNHPDGRNKRSVWIIPTKPYSEAHFATYPPDLIEPCVLAGCPEGGTVLDPFAGSGTTGLVAKQHNRNAVLIELNEEYIEIAKQRINPPQTDFFFDERLVDK